MVRIGNPGERVSWPPGLIAGIALVVATLVGGAPLAAAVTPADELDALKVQVPREATPAPGFTLPRPDGPPLSLADLRGTVVFLNFWATWCVPCRDEMPALEKLYRAYRERSFTVVAVNVRESKDTAAPFLREVRVTFPAVLDGDGAVARLYAVRSLPVSLLVDREGRILFKAFGEREWDGPHARAYIESVLQDAKH